MQDRFMRLAEVLDATGLCEATIWRLERRGEFPRRRRLTGRQVGWSMLEVEAWCAARPIVRIGESKPDNEVAA
jgi:prophage regulatory protein